MDSKSDTNKNVNGNKSQKVELKSHMYNHDSEKITRREETNDAVLWGFVLGFGLFIILLIIMIIFVH